MSKYNYLLVYTLPITVFIAFHLQGYWTFLPIGIFFVLVPLLELIIPKADENATPSVKDTLKKDRFFDAVLFSTVPIQVGLLLYFLTYVSSVSLSTVEFIGCILAMGLSCGVLGLNVGHELGHRSSRWQQLMGEIMLLTSMDTHFLPYHNAGHHRNVATPADSATARKNEILITFWIRSHFGSYKEAWVLENERMRQSNRSIWSLKNRMMIYTIANVALLVIIYTTLGTTALIAYLGAALMGILLLETVNYIEHYGLLRKQVKPNRYERVKHTHSWNSDHVLGRSILFNLSRHSDHHYNGSKAYQLLDSLEKSPQMPTGYPGMMMLSLFQPLWFRIMNKKLEELERTSEPV